MSRSFVDKGCPCKETEGIERICVLAAILCRWEGSAHQRWWVLHQAKSEGPGLDFKEMGMYTFAMKSRTSSPVHHENKGSS
jgi:hypothetical protein